ncbi:LysR family transcriptional regulator [Polaromonas aquatica]|uniref:LysR family transcriptional regulator n=1 Tax=Polaromonas aquatica TaxID=332657 RepID=UPI003D659192
MPTASLIPQLLNRLRMRQVALILAVGEHGTLRKASAELGMTQPAATKMIQELESALGQRLFERVGRGQKLTPAGTSVLRYFRGMRGSVESMTRELAELQLGSSGRVSVGSIMAPSPNLLTHAIITLKKTYPLLSVDVMLDTSDRLFELLREGVLDVAIGRIRDEHRADYTFTPLENEALAVVAGVHHPLGQKKVVKFASLLDYPWILQPKGSPMREVLEQEFRMLQAPTPKGLIETASILTTTNLIAETDMVGVMPQSIADNYARHGLLKVLPCLIQHKMEAFGSIIRKDRPLSDAARFFLAALHRK